MPAQTGLASSEHLLPSIDYASEPVRPSRLGSELKLVAATVAPPRSEADASPAAAPPAAADMHPTPLAATSEAAADDRRPTALRSLTEEEIIALFG